MAGQTLTATLPALVPVPDSVEYTWSHLDALGEAIGSGGPTYVVTAADAGHKMVVTASPKTRGYNKAAGFDSLPTELVPGEVIPDPGEPAPANPIDELYAVVGAEILGEPTGPEITGLRSGGASRNYEHGTIVWSPATGAKLSMGGIRATWLLYKAENGQLGYPTTHENTEYRHGGIMQYYQGGAIVWSPTTGSQVSMGGIRVTWRQNFGEEGQLGYPTSQEIAGLRNGGVIQYYQGGAIVWSPASGSQVSMGGIRTTWLLNGAENGQLGYPTSREVTGLRNGGVLQYYQGGAIVWSPASGSQVSMGAIRTAWAGTGYEKGRLGYPISREYPLEGGGVAQDYQGGRITWAPGKGASVLSRKLASPSPARDTRAGICTLSAPRPGGWRGRGGRTRTSRS